MRIVSKVEDWYKEYAKSCEIVAKWLVRKLKIESGSKIVELGCGEGAFTIPLALNVKDSEVIAIDNDERALKNLRLNIKKLRINNVLIKRGDARKLREIKDNSIDFVFSHWLLGVVLKYNDLKRIIKENYRILKKGGIVAHSESYPFPRNKAQELYMKADILAFHTRWWDPEKIKNLMEKLGFKNVSINLKNFNLKIDPKISMQLIKEWQKLESYYAKQKITKNIKLKSFLRFHRKEIEKYGLEFPTEYVIISEKS